MGMCAKFMEVPDQDINSHGEDVGQVYYFQTEVNQMLSLIVNTFYKHKEIFLRELISNSSDALDKIRFMSLNDPDVLATEPELCIQIIPNKATNTLTIGDTGIGMTKLDLINNLGTIARSGTKKFVEALEAGDDISLIGQFGVGFYSCYLVSKKVFVVSKNNCDDWNSWESLVGGAFKVKKIKPVKDLGRGTRISIFLKDDQLEFLEERRIRDIVKRHSEFICYPIALQVERTVEKDIISNTKGDANSKDKTSENSDSKRLKEVVKELVVLNKQKPIWMKKKEDVSRQEYANFYKSISNDWEDHLAVKHFSVEGQLEFRAIIFVPKRAPFDLFDSRKKLNNIKLYVRRVFIMDDCIELIPEYLNFIKGIVDSEDLPLNISRETLQQNKILKVIKKNLVKKSLEMFFEIANDEDDYAKFYNAFSKNIKLGIHEDSQNREKLAELLRYSSSMIKDEVVSFNNYISRSLKKQKSIYYIIGDNKTNLEKSPFIEKLVANGIEVLFMTDPMDEYCMQQLKEYNGHKLVCVTKEGLNLDEILDPQVKIEDLKKTYASLCETMKDVLNTRIEKITVSERVEKSPACIITGEYGWTANMERIMKAQALRDSSMSTYMSSKKIMEINPNHIIIKELLRRTELDKTDVVLRDLIYLLYELTLLVSGFALDNPFAFGKRVTRMVELGLSIDNNEPFVTKNGLSAKNKKIIKNNKKVERID